MDHYSNPIGFMAPRPINRRVGIGRPYLPFTGNCTYPFNFKTFRSHIKNIAASFVSSLPYLSLNFQLPASNLRG